MALHLQFLVQLLQWAAAAAAVAVAVVLAAVVAAVVVLAAVVAVRAQHLLHRYQSHLCCNQLHPIVLLIIMK